MKWTPGFIVGSLLLVAVTGLCAVSLARPESWVALGQIVAVAAKMVGAG